MLRRALLASAGLAALAACMGAPVPSPRDEAPPAEPASPPAPPSPAVTDVFDVALYRALAAQPGNVFVSPLSVASAFALVYPGAHGQTETEIAAALGFDPSPATQATRTRALAQALASNNGGSQFTTANAAWVERTMALRAGYARTIREEVGATIEAVDFIANQRAALRRINAWAANQTQDRIRELLTSEDPDRRLVLTNAVYFKGKWSDPFAASATRDGDFFPATGAAVRTRLMRQITHARYFEDSGVQIAEFDYVRGAFALAVFLPRARAGLAAFERDLTGARLDAWLARLQTADQPRLDVTLPKVRLEASYELAPTLQSLGMRVAFTDAVDFSGVTDATGLKISAVVHKTFLAIDEDGTEAAAATAIDMVATAAPIAPPAPPIEFKADRPFFIVLRHKPSGARVFVGRIAAP
ncbi:MAG: serpin family protein [Hyphomonadaceae bacterium]|nr:serpin family protein [Hyphomonadaceae bacterium]